MLNTAEREFARELASRVRDLRMRRVLSQQDLAARAGLSRNVIINVEQGARLVQPKSLQKIARALRVKPEQLTAD